ncbi:MAG: DUF3365 domain-containing protein [Gemmatimonadales bacterium]
MRAGPIAGLIVLAACGGSGREAAPAGPDSAAVAGARAAAGRLATGLMGRLVVALDSGGPTAAIGYCADSAQALTAALQTEGFVVRRVGTRIRNLGNGPDSLEAAVLARFAERLARGEPLPADTTLIETGPAGRTLRVLKPVLVAEPCLACHGDPATFAPVVSATLADRYPADRATGYRIGELRGAVSVRRPLR